ncbi:MAG: pseudouridine synthase [Candidatus Paceibacterota bacterium]
MKKTFSPKRNNSKKPFVSKTSFSSAKKFTGPRTPTYEGSKPSGSKPYTPNHFAKKSFGSKTPFARTNTVGPKVSNYEGSKPFTPRSYSPTQGLNKTFTSRTSFAPRAKPARPTSPRYMGSKPQLVNSFIQNRNNLKPVVKKQFASKNNAPAPVSTDPSLMRINKYLAEKNYSTRRGADEMIAKGQVFINGRVAVLGDKVSDTDLVKVSFRGKQKPYMYIAYNKPRGIVTHSAQKGDQEIKNVFALKDVYPIGRLDKDSHGLIILTNDGRITERLLGPKYAHEKEYIVTTKNDLRSNFKEKMEAGVQIEADKTAPCRVQILSERSFKVVLTEGKKHQIRRMCSALFQEVDDLKRTRIMNIKLDSLSEGAHRKIEGEELKTFLTSLGII